MGLLVTLIQEMSLFAVIAYIYSKSPAFKPLTTRTMQMRDYLYLYLFFTGLTIMGTYLGLPIKDAIANTRAIGAVMAGLVGGPVLGGIVGFSGGLHRYLLGGFTAFSCGVSTTLEGLIGGLFHHYYMKRDEADMVFNYKVAFMATFISETVQMSVILLFSRPLTEAWALVQVIGLPMIIANSVGAALFISILKDQKNMLDEYGSIFSKKALGVARRTLDVLSKGFTPEAAEEVANIVLQETGVGAVAITDRENIIAYVGLGSNHHQAGKPISSDITRQAIRTKEVIFADGRHVQFECPGDPSCPLGSALVVPLMVENEVVGTVKMYEPKSRTFLNINKTLGKGIADLLSTQLLISRYEQQKNLLVKSELKLLQAQVNPHFLFNALNTIASVVRTDPPKAKELILHLSNFFRKNLKRGSDLATVKEELEHITSYLDIEMARFQDRLVVNTDIDASLHGLKIPTFTLQPIVENAIKHGISQILGQGIINIRGYRKEGVALLEIEDNAGTYCSEKRSKEAGLGMKIVDKRIKNLYGDTYGISVSCVEGEFSRITILLPA